MTTKVHCDGPGCEKSYDSESLQVRAFGDAPWITIERVASNLNFCSWTHVVRYAMEEQEVKPELVQ